MSEPNAFPRRWNICRAELIAETFSSRIWKVWRDDADIAVVKALKPFDDVDDELRGVYFLEWRDGEGAVRLFDSEGSDMLLEYGGERLLTNVLDTDGDDAATEIAADVLSRLHRSSRRPAPPQLQPLRQRFDALFARAGKAGGSGNDDIYRQAAASALFLLESTQSALPLHGDLHHDNIVFGSRGWLAIDPKGVFGDPCFDAANLFYNPLDRASLCSHPGRVVCMAKILSRKLGLDPSRMLDFAFAYGCLSAAWHCEDGNKKDEARELVIASTIRSVRPGI